MKKLTGTVLAVLVNLWVLRAEAKVTTNTSKNHNHHQHHIETSSVELLSWGKDATLHRGRKDIYLSHYPPHFAVVVLIVNDVPWTQADLRSMSGHFAVHAPPTHGVMAVVQAMHLRSNAVIEHCIDYIQFYEPKSAKGSLKICGKLSKDNQDYSPAEILGPRVFHSSPGTGGMMQVQYKSDRGDRTTPSSLLSNNGTDGSFHMVEIVFTAYKDCDAQQDSSEVECGGKCISSKVLCDERINCGLFKEDFALDEMNCTSVQESQSYYGGHSVGAFLLNVLLGALLLCLIITAIASYHQYKTYRRIKNIPQP